MSAGDQVSSTVAPERVAAARHMLDIVHGQIRAADEKVRVLFSGSALLAAALAFTNPGGGALPSLGILNQVIIGLHILLLISVAVAVVSAIAALLPRVSAGQQGRSLYFFSDIAATSHAEFLKEFNEASDSILLRQALSQVHVNATIVKIKYIWIRRATMSFAAAVLILVVKQALMLLRA